VTPERWAQIEELFHCACECDSKGRDALLDEACRTDPELRREVEALLASEENAGDHLHAAVREQLQSVGFPLAGETISHYRILDGLAGGGMGLVYRAEDIKLGRRVALKFLPEDSAKDGAALGRFEREARAASALEHPNICPIYEFGEHQGRPFLVMQLLEGQTLRELISGGNPGNPPLTLAKLLDLAIQVTAGLEAAHSQGIIHRDIKPANLFVTSQGQVKILDFGLAKLASLANVPRDSLGAFHGDDDEGAQQTTEKVVPMASPDAFLSLTGVAMGTAGYMSPEQVRGEKLDARTDLFSFGLVLYELATGQRAFKGDTGPSLQRAILNDTPASVRELNPKVPPKLEKIIGRALIKDREARYQSVSDLHADLEALRREIEQKLSVGGRGIAAGVAAVLLIVSTVFWFTRHQPSSSQTQSAEPLLPAVEVVPLVAMKGNQVSPAFSPDGNQVAFAEVGEPETAGIYTTVIGGEKSLRLTRDPGDCCPTWSPDSREIAFVRYSQEEMSFYVVPALGGSEEHRLYTGPANLRTGGSRLDWSPDGRVLAFAEPSAKGLRSRIALLSLADLTRLPLTSPPDQEFDCEPAFSPDGSNVAYTRGRSGGQGRDIFVLPANGGEPRRLTFDNSNGSPVWTQDGRDIVFSSQRGRLSSLWRVSASGGPPRPLAGVGAVALNPSIPRKGNQLAFQHVVTSNQIWRINLNDERHALDAPVHVISSRGFNRRPNFSPDGKRVAFESDRLGYSDIWYCDSDGSNCAQLTSLHGTAGTARWSPDGRYIVFEFQSQRFYQIYVVEVPGGRPRLVPTFPAADNGAPNWSRDGQWIYFYSNHEKGPVQLWKVPFKGGSPVRVTRNGGVYAIESDDGRFLYYSKLEQPGIWKMPLNGGEETRILDKPEGYHWHSWGLARDGIYFLYWSDTPNGKIEFFDFATRKTTPIFGQVRPAPSHSGLALSPNGRALLYTDDELKDSDLMLVKNFR